MKLGRTTKIRQNFFFLSSFSFLFFPNNKNSAEFFCAFGSFNHSRYQCFLSLWFNPSQLSLSSSVSAFVSILANRSSTAQPVLQVSLYSFLRIAPPLRLPPSIHPSTSSYCFDILSTTVSLFVLGPLGCAVYPMLTVGVTYTQLSRPLFCFGCATYPMLVVGVTCT